MIDKKVSRVSLVVYVVLLLLSTTLMCMPGGALVWYLVMLLFTLLPIISGPKTYRIIGIVLLIFTVTLCIMEYRRGQQWRQRMFNKVKQQKEVNGTENYIP
jgi:hypothetical protein